MKIKPAYIGLLLIAIMFGSTIAYGILQAAFYGTTARIELPKENIVSHELTEEQENLLLRNGKAILRYEYNLVCNNCLEWKSLLEQLTSSQQFQNQIFLQEILINQTDVELPRLKITGFRISADQASIDQQLLEGNITQDDIINSVCDLVLQPPVQCALRKV